MEKANVVMIVLNREFLYNAIQNLDLDKANLKTLIMDGDWKFLQVGETKFPVTSFANAPKIIKTYKNYVWLIVGHEKGIGDVLKMKKFLMSFDVKEDNIVNFEMDGQISSTWLANLLYIVKRGADFFATGNEYIRDNLDMKFIPRANANKELAKGGVNLADVKQDLQQSYLTAKFIFNHVAPGTIKFVLIGLTPNSFRYDNAKDFPHCGKNFQYAASLNSYQNAHDIMLRNLISDEVKKFFVITLEQADLNFDALKKSFNEFSVKAVSDWEDEPKILPENSVEKNIQILKDYIKLCLANGAKPVGVVFPFAPIARKNYDAELLKSFRETIRQLEENYDFTCVDMFEKLGYDCFSDMTHLNSNGTISTHSLLSLKLCKRDCLPVESFLDINYEYFYRLAWAASKDEYNALLEQIFKVSMQKIRRKDKIKIGFTMVEAAHWCGKDLYDLFANDERFETSVFLCRDFSKPANAVVKKDFWHGVEQLESHGIKVIAVDDRNAAIPAQDVLIYLSPYVKRFSKFFQFSNVTPKTLVVHIPYGFDSSYHIKVFYSGIIFLTLWKVFFSSLITFDIYKKKCVIGAPRGLYSGYPRMDVFFKSNTKFHFDWKMARPDAKKIIWAPHHSIVGDDSIRYATFHWNYKFMYEFAKAHPEISWVVKPHPWLLYTAVREKVFPSTNALQKYLQRWNELPNAMVYTGAYYQEIFATSDGMIHDCGSFTAEYQFVDKPMIYLTRDTQKFNELGEEILKVSYLVNGKDFKGIAAIMQKVFIEGNDDKAAERRKLFDKYLNYPKANGMLASEFIYKSIADEFKEDS